MTPTIYTQHDARARFTRAATTNHFELRDVELVLVLHDVHELAGAVGGGHPDAHPVLCSRPAPLGKLHVQVGEPQVNGAHLAHRDVEVEVALVDGAVTNAVAVPSGTRRDVRQLDGHLACTVRDTVVGETVVDAQ